MDKAVRNLANEKVLTYHSSASRDRLYAILVHSMFVISMASLIIASAETIAIIMLLI